MQQKFRAISAAVLIGVISIFLTFSQYTEEPGGLQRAERVGELRIVGGEFQRSGEKKICMENGLTVLSCQPVRAVKNIQRVLLLFVAGITGALIVRRMEERISLRSYGFLPVQFLYELLIRLEKDGKKRICSTDA